MEIVICNAARFYFYLYHDVFQINPLKDHYWLYIVQMWFKN